MTSEDRGRIREARDAATRARVFTTQCPHCHKPLPATYVPHRRFCSPHCRKVHWQKQNRAAA